MARYRKVDPRIWNDEKFLSLSDDGQLLFLFLLTHPHMTSLGAMRATIAGLAEERRWTTQRLSKAFLEISKKGLIEHDRVACYVGIPNFLRYNGPESPNVVSSWKHAPDFIPECTLKDELLQRVKDFVKALPKKWQRLPEGFGKGSARARALEQEQEQEQEKREGDIAGASPLRSKNGTAKKAFQKPTVADVAAYCLERKNGIDPEQFVAFYESKNWFVGKNKMASWKHAVITWEKRQPKTAAAGRPLTDEELEALNQQGGSSG